MTNQNPASSQQQSTKLSQEILAKVNSHADRSIDRLFADIEELLSGDLSGETQSPPYSTTQLYSRPLYPSASAQPPTRNVEPQRQPPQYEQYRPATPAATPPPPVEAQPQPQPSATPKQQKQGTPLWTKTFLMIGVTSIALSSLLMWLINERKINIDTSWLPFAAPSQLSPDDTKFAEYMRKSISKIETANTETSTASSTAPANSTNPVVANAPATASPSASISPGATGVVADVNASDPSKAKVSISLLSTIPNAERPGANFEINGQSQTVEVGKKIGNTTWSLLTVAKGEVIIKRVGGEIRSIYVGQKFWSFILSPSISMGLFEDMKRFLESQIDDFLTKNPHLELQVIEEQLAQQESDTFQLIIDLQVQGTQIEQEILVTAQEIKNWYDRVQKATAVGRVDLATAAQNRVNALLPQGNQLWGRMQGLKERKAKAQELLQTIKARRTEVRAKAAEAQTVRVQSATASSSWGSVNNYTSPSNSADPLEAQFQRWEADEELEKLKRNLSK